MKVAAILQACSILGLEGWTVDTRGGNNALLLYLACIESALSPYEQRMLRNQRLALPTTCHALVQNTGYICVSNELILITISQSLQILKSDRLVHHTSSKSEHMSMVLLRTEYTTFGLNGVRV